MPAEKEQIFKILESNFQGCKLDAKDMTGDKDHWEVHISHPSFSGKSRIEQHRAVMNVLTPLNIHAVSLKILSN
ncbi:MAG TPA: hypothetical protein DIV86_07075 [Alphaproteobacteria bacterium]|nr:hypothetical protein [Alphaproteobacteria bacterium]